MTIDHGQYTIAIERLHTGEWIAKIRRKDGAKIGVPGLLNTEAEVYQSHKPHVSSNDALAAARDLIDQGRIR